MALNERLVGEVEKARERLERLESDVFDARQQFHASIRRLHGAGASMREIATALGMSHQRVHQIVGEDAPVEVEAASTDVTPHPAAPRGEVQDSIRTSRKRARRATLRCSFCNASQAQVSKLIAGPTVFICGLCVTAAHGVASTGEATPGPRGIALAVAAREPHPCSFCARRTPAVATIVKGPRARICNECLAVCDEVMAAGAGPVPTS